MRISRINAKLVGLASGINGRRTLEAITELAADYDAVAVDRFNLIRKTRLSDMGRAGAT